MKNRVSLLLVASMLGGCAALPSLFQLPGGGGDSTQILMSTSVGLSKDNYKIVKANAIGESWGISLLGLIPVKTPYYTEAITQIYQQGGEMEGKPRALVNIVHQQSSNFYLLFSMPEITVRADVVEFVPPPEESDH